MKRFWSIGIAAIAWSVNLFGQKNPYLLPKSILVQSGLDSTFVAKCALFIAVLLLGTLLIGKILKIVLKLPVIAGQIVGGIVLGPSLIDLPNHPFFTEPLTFTDEVTQKLFAVIPSDLFVFFVLMLSSAFTVTYLLWLAGYETNVRDLLKVGATAVGAGFFGAVIPILMTVGGMQWLYPAQFSLVTMIGIGIVFAATSVSIPVAMLVSSNKMHLKSSQATLGAAIVDDILAVILLSLFMMAAQSGLLGPCKALVASGHHCSIGKSLLFLVVCAFVILGFGFLFIPPIMQKLRDWKLVHLIAPIATATMLIYFAFSELVGGLAGITGAYFAGVFQRVSDTRRIAEKVCAPFVNGILLPIFLGSIGLQVDLNILTKEQWVLVGILLILSILSKLIGCGISTGISNLSQRRKTNRWTVAETYLFGSSMVARGEVGLVISTILRGAQVITPDIYVLCVVVIILTTIAAPMMLSLGFYYMDTQQIKQGEKGFSLKLGNFKIIGTQQMFNIIEGRLTAQRNLATTVHFSEGRKIINLEKDNVKIVFAPGKGIFFEGDRTRIMEIISEVKHEALNELEKISLN
jgi:Kef-type K+ transport system membrane component KefB